MRFAVEQTAALMRACPARSAGRVAGIRALGLLLCGPLACCASYRPQPLAAHPALAADIADLAHPVAVPADRLGVGDIALLAVANNPDLKAARARLGVAEAQVLQAGLLPNPQISGNVAPNLYAPAAISTAWSLGITQDIKSIITLPARRKAARAEAASVRADLLWQEWQVIGKARLLTVDLITAARQRALLERTRALLAGLTARTERALDHGNATLAEASPELAALNGVRIEIATLDRQIAQWHDALTSLLGLVPEARLSLAPRVDLPPFDATAARRAMMELASHRPDFVALQLGYAAQEARVRAAILAQFPALLIGALGGEDNTRDYTAGPQVTFDLPLFDRNQGRIAIARATRQRLHDEYAARLATATAKVGAMLADIALLQRQIAAAHRDAASTAAIARAAERAYRAGNLDARSYVDFVRTSLDAELQVARLAQSLLEQRVAIDTLTGAGMPAIRPRGEAAPQA